MKAKHYYVNTPKSLILDTTLSGNDLRVLLYLALRQAGDENCFPGIRTIARKLCIVKSTVQLSINRLRRTGYLTVWRKRASVGYRNIYKVSLKSVPKISTLPYRKSVHTHYTIIETDPAREGQVGLKASATREAHEQEIMRQIEQEALTRREQRGPDNQPAEQSETTNPPDKEAENGTK